jgi:hypothetical protein
MGAFRGYVAGIVTPAEIIADFDLQGEELTMGTALKDNIDAEVGALAKIIYVLKVEGVAFLLDQPNDTIYHTAPGVVDKTRVKTDLGW